MYLLIQNINSIKIALHVMKSYQSIIMQANSQIHINFWIHWNYNRTQACLADKLLLCFQMIMNKGHCANVINHTCYLCKLHNPVLCLQGALALVFSGQEAVLPNPFQSIPPRACALLRTPASAASGLDPAGSPNSWTLAIAPHSALCCPDLSTAGPAGCPCDLGGCLQVPLCLRASPGPSCHSGRSRDLGAKRVSCPGTWWGQGKKRQGNLGFCERPPEVLLVLLTITWVYVRTTPTDDRPAELTLTGTLGSHQGPWPSFMADTHPWV